MNTSQTINEIAKAFLKAQESIEAVKKGAENPFFKSKYADLPSVIDACKGILNKQGIAILQPIIGDFVETRLIHVESGEWLASKTKIVCKVDNDPQAYGSAITYARRYGLQSMVFMSAEDDDGEGAMSRSPSMAKSPTHPDNEFNKSVCQHCGGKIAISAAGKPYCVNKCWLPENSHLRTK
jgi:ribosomal protein L40E